MSQSKTASSGSVDEYPYTGGSHPDRTGPALVLEALFSVTRDLCVDIGGELELGDAPFTICGDASPALDWVFDAETQEAINPDAIPGAGTFTLYVIEPEQVENGLRYSRVNGDDGEAIPIATFTFQTEVLDADIGSDEFYGRERDNEAPTSEPYAARAFGPEHEVRVSNIVYEKLEDNIDRVEALIES